MLYISRREVVLHERGIDGIDDIMFFTEQLVVPLTWREIDD